MLLSFWPIYLMLFGFAALAIVFRALGWIDSGGKRGRRGRRGRERDWNLLDAAFDDFEEVAPDQDLRLPYKAAGQLMSGPEAEFFAVLQQAVAGRSAIFAQVSLAALVKVRIGGADRTAAWNRISQKYVDFVLCEHGRGCKPELVIELDDSSHNRPDRAERDALVDRILEKAKLPILHVKRARAYSPTQLEQDIRAKLGQSTITAPLRGE